MCKQHPDLTNELSCHDPAPPVDGEGPWLAVVTPAQDLIFTLRMSDKKLNIAYLVSEEKF